MALRQYIGARYVPKFYENSLGTSAWESGVIYEPLTIVTYNGNSYTSKKTVPASVGDPSSNPAYWVATGMYNQQISDLSTIVTALQGDVDSVEEDISLIQSEIVTVKDFGDTIDGFPYGAFCGGCVFNGMELYAFRVAPTHKTYLGQYGEIVFFRRRPGNVFERMPITLSYDSLTYGELRDPNLSVSRDGSRLYVSCFTTIDDSDNTHYSLVFCFDRSLTQIAVNVIPNSVFWGNTLETPAGYLIHADYEGNNLALYKTTQVITSANIASATWTKLTPFTQAAGRTYAEPTIGYFNNRLVMVCRTGGTYSAEVAWTPNLEGDSGWTANMGYGPNIHAPAMMQYFKGELLPISGSIIDAALTGDPNKRLPYISILGFDDTVASTNTLIYQAAGGLLVGADEFEYYGGYTTMVRLSDDVYGVMYYEDTQGGDNAVKFRECHLYDSRVNMGYLSLEPANPPVIYTIYAQNSYNHELRPWVLALLSGGKYKSVTFISTSSAASITDGPAGLQSNFFGRAQRVSTQYYIEVEYFSGTVPKKAAITGTSSTIISATWTQIY